MAADHSNSAFRPMLHDNISGGNSENSNGEYGERQDFSKVRATPYRFVILLVFVLLSASNAMSWIFYSIITNIITDFYGVSARDVDWLSMLYMITYIILIFPGSWFLDKYGLKTSIVIGASGNALGAILKIWSANPDSFWLTFLGQTISGSSQVFILGLPPRLASVWFGSKEVSTACAVGVFGNQMGIAIGFVLPPLLILVGTKAQVAHYLFDFFLASAILNTAILVAVVVFFKEKPEVPPSLAQAHAQIKTIDSGYLKEITKCFKSKSFNLLLLCYGLNVGVFYALSTLLQQIIIYYYPNTEKECGTIGLLIVVAGMFGSVFTGFLLDKYHKYKETTLGVYFFSFLGTLLLTFGLGIVPLIMIGGVAIFLGFFMTGYIALGFEYAAEITYPIAEHSTSGLLNASAQLFGMLMVIGFGRVRQILKVD
uniref:MFS domain-containing protein n=1 Tax=Rhabditophanes sp. KR3021 TaxID=114890 RepID=A0AC35U9K2_9BILA